MSKIENPELYRIKVLCQLGKDALDVKEETDTGIDRTDYAIYNLLSAMEYLAAYLERKEDGQ